jgi:DNA polymerase-3 subunit chi
LKVYIHTASASDTQQLDDLLWTFRDGSFLPHAIHSAAADEAPPILLGHDHEPATHTGVLINLGSDIPRFFARFERVVEVVDQRTELLTQSRERYVYYRDRGYEPKSHKL